MKADFLDDILSQRSKVSVLRCLFRSGEELSGREIARRTGLSPKMAHDTLKALLPEGVVSLKVVPPVHLYSIKRGNWIVEELLRGLFKRESSMLDDISKEISNHVPKFVISIILFGSVARGESNSKSDIDIVVVVDKEISKTRIIALFEHKNKMIERKFNRRLSNIFYTISEFREKHLKKLPLIREILKTGWVIYGKLITEVLNVSKTDSR